MLIRPRRNRKSNSIRDLVAENNVSVNDLVYPLFLVDGKGIKQEVKSLPGNYRFSLDTVLIEIKECVSLGLTTFILFPAVDEKLKDKNATYGSDPANFYIKYITEIKRHFPTVTLISDVAMDPYSSDGHDGYVREGRILNDKTLPILAKMAVSQAKAGIDIIGPSDMMDGRIGYLREALDKEGYSDTSIMAYTAKYASAFYGPFRDALDSAPKEGDKKTYQMDPRNKKEAIREALLDIEEGADFIMVKPAVHYLDVIQELQSLSDVPVAAYHVSGECAMILAASEKGWLDLESTVSETLISLKRAGTNVIITYFAKYFAKLQK